MGLVVFLVILVLLFGGWFLFWFSIPLLWWGYEPVSRDHYFGPVVQVTG
jgi:hypothetical protein